MTDRMPILYDHRERRALTDAGLKVPNTIPWDFVATRARCLSNHSQTGEVLASRGGLAPLEAIAILKGQPWPGAGRYLKHGTPEWVERERAHLDELVRLVFGEREVRPRVVPVTVEEAGAEGEML